MRPQEGIGSAGYSARRFDQDEGVTAEGAWALTFRRCDPPPAGCGIFQLSAGIGGFAISRVGATTTGADTFPSLWGNHLAYVRQAPDRQYVRVEELSTAAARNVGARAPAPRARVSSLDLQYPRLAVAWRWRDARGALRSRVDLVDLQNDRTRVLMRAGGPRQPRGELVSPAFVTDRLYFALGGDRSRFYRLTSDGALEARGAPRHLTSFAVGIVYAGPPGEVMYFQTAQRGGGGSAGCAVRGDKPRPDGCVTWSRYFSGAVPGFA